LKLPRDVSGDDLAKALVELGDRATRQTGSHLRLTTTERGEAASLGNQGAAPAVGLSSILASPTPHAGVIHQGCRILVVHIGLARTAVDRRIAAALPCAVAARSA
jgi:hypothetical protein